MEVFRLGDGEIGKRIVMDEICDMASNSDSRDLYNIVSKRKYANQKDATCHIGVNVNGWFVNLVGLEG